MGNNKVSIQKEEKIPGNYPADYVEGEKKSEHRILLVCDIRGFTQTMEESPEATLHFVSEFFDDIAGIVHRRFENAYINKYLGDGIFAHFPDNSPDREKAAKNAVEAAFNIQKLFKKQRKKYEEKLSKMGLSIVLSKEEIYFKGKIGKSYYIDYTLVGRSVNRVFRALESAKGNLVLIFDNMRDIVAKEYILIDLGRQTYDGVYEPVRLYSVMRKKEKDEGFVKKKGKEYIRLCRKSCGFYSTCRNAFARGERGEKFINCQDWKGMEEKPCEIWDKCIVRLRYGKEHKGHRDFQCCYIYPNFVNCFHNYYQGINYKKGGMQVPMIWCGVPSYPFRKGEF